jgi:hypothetical protein
MDACRLLSIWFLFDVGYFRVVPKLIYINSSVMWAFERIKMNQTNTYLHVYNKLFYIKIDQNLSKDLIDTET